MRGDLRGTWRKTKLLSGIVSWKEAHKNFNPIDVNKKKIIIRTALTISFFFIEQFFSFYIY